MIGKFSHTYRLLVRYDDNNSNKQQQHDRLHEENTEMLNDRLAGKDTCCHAWLLFLLLLLIDPDYLLPWKYVVGVDITVWDKSSLPICPICLCTADVPRIPECGHVMCLSCALRYLQDYRQCCVCNVAITLRELKPVRMEIMDGKPRSGDIITFNLCEVVDGICRPFDADTLQKSFNHKCGYDDKKNKIQIPPRMGRDFGWRYSRVVNVGDDDNTDDEVRILLYRELKRLNNRIRDEEWVDDLECMGVYMARDHVLKQLQDESLDHHDNADDHDRNERGCWGDDADDNGILIPDTVTNAIIDEAEERRKNDHRQQQQHAVNTNSSDVNTTTSTSNDSADHPHPSSSSSSSSSSNAYFYQLSYGGGHVYLDPLWFKCLMVEYTGKPDAFDSMYLLPRMIRCRVVSIQDVAIDDTSSIASRKKYRSLAHLVHGSTASIVDVDFIKPTKLSHATIEALKPQIDRKYKYRKEQRRKAHKEDKLKIEAEDRIHKEEFTRLISTAPTVHSSRTTTNNNNSINDVSCYYYYYWS
ncbi:hypothetical protein FOZ60_008089 [Perkinsus olseni]|uniref:RING-type domain-containing protein n=1 Tax=Perkinsus olseni TaxID=32597 RepID=A0A7J6NLI5_PEROL|nr:hypothetical protein FOZ60_008089 [Perkinsus olseni]